jgi:NAD(P)-dependent dehydrogenase (short-subunit alcohol dehydrogenase family)
MPTALVTGASRGVGKGVAISLTEAGYTVFATGRTIAQAALPEAVIRIPCDHTRPEQTDGVFRRISEEAGALDLLVNSAWGGYERMVENGQFTWNLPFWEQPAHRWTDMMEAGVHAAFDCSARAARMMVAAKSGLIVNISFWAARKHIGNAVYGIAKAATDKMTADMAHELKDYGVAVVSLYPGLVRTEAVLEAAKGGFLDLSNSESPDYIGRVIAALAADSDRMARSGQVLVAATLGAEYGVTDIDGRQPEPLNLDQV